MLVSVQEVSWLMRGKVSKRILRRKIRRGWMNQAPAHMRYISFKELLWISEGSLQ